MVADEEEHGGDLVPFSLGGKINVSMSRSSFQLSCSVPSAAGFRRTPVQIKDLKKAIRSTRAAVMKDLEKAVSTSSEIEL